VVAEHHLVLALEDVVADHVRLDHLEAELLAHLAHDSRARVLARLEESRHQREESLGPELVAREDDLALVLDQGAHGRRGIAPVHEAARPGGTGEARAFTAIVDDLAVDEGCRAGRTESKLHEPIFSCPAPGSGS
jgi:hypothetical protein